MEPPQHFDPGRHRRLTGGLVSSDSPGAGGQPLEACPGRGGGSQAAVEAATSHEARNSGMDRCFFFEGELVGLEWKCQFLSGERCGRIVCDGNMSPSRSPL